MFLAEPQKTPYDLHFQIMGFNVRVSPFFWVMAAVLGWEFARSLAFPYSEEQLLSYIEKLPPELVPDSTDEILQQQTPYYQERYQSNPGQGMLLLIWMAAVFVSILVHELGHALAFRCYGINSYMVLYHFGGLAIPESAGSFMSMKQRSDPYQQIFISAAGPGLQLALAAVVILLVKGSGYSVPNDVPYVSDWLQLDQSRKIGSTLLYAVVVALLWPSIFWAILNLVPVYPLDGGQISRELLVLYSPREGMRNSLILSMIVGGLIAAYGLSSGQMMLGMMFGMLAFSSYQILQAFSGRGGGYGPW